MRYEFVAQQFRPLPNECACDIFYFISNERKEDGMKSTFMKYALLLVFVIIAAGCAETQKVEGPKDNNSGVKGQVFYENKGAAVGVYVYAYDSPFNDLRVPTKLISEPTAADGSYVLKLAPGTYYIVARKRTTGDPKGYLVKGDYEGKYPGNPVTVRAGEFTTVKVSIAKLEGAFLAAPYLPKEGTMSISGKISDESGKPASGAYALVYTDKAMTGMPAYLSKPTGTDGDYSVVLPKSGTYYVAARLKFGGVPKKGEPYGMYERDPEHKVAVGEKEIVTGIDMKLTPFPFDIATPQPAPSK